MANTEFKAVATSKGGLEVECKARGFIIKADEPQALGGGDTAMNPVEMLLSALGACKVIVARSFAEANNIRLNGVEIECTGVLDPDGFTGQNKDAKIGLSEIVTEFRFSADNTEEELEAFANFIDSTCPVQDTILNSPKASHRVIKK